MRILSNITVTNHSICDCTIRENLSAVILKLYITVIVIKDPLLYLSVVTEHSCLLLARESAI